jgi:hypothetical protein
VITASSLLGYDATSFTHTLPINHDNGGHISETNSDD